MNLNEIILTPGNCSKDCLGNGEHFESNNELIECCCEECDYANCDTCEFNDRGCCQMINSISEWLNNELTEEQMIRSINWEYNARKEEN